MSESAPAAGEHADWKAPTEDGGCLIWPAAGEWASHIDANRRRLRSTESVRFQNVPLPEVRQGLRAFLGHTDAAVPLLMTGHQTELHHPGVWVKTVLIDAAAARIGGAAHQVAVDTDAPRHLSLQWPASAKAGARSAMPLTDDPGALTAAWAGLLQTPTPAHLHDLRTALEAAAAEWPFQPMAGDVLASMRRLALESPTLPAALTNALHELDWGLGLRYGALLASPIWTSPPYLLFAHHLLARGGVFASDYNASLAEHRHRNKIRAPGRPMPDLACDGSECEAPFWLDDLARGSRTRCRIERASDTWTLHPPGADGQGADGFGFDPGAAGWEAANSLADWLRHHNLRLAPRALTLTAVFRLLAADWFVHGIGGARYDQVLDSLIERHFHLAPPRFAVATATLYFPGASERTRACVHCVRHEGHHLRHALLGDEKKQLVRAIHDAPRGSIRRSVLFHEMHRGLTDAARNHPAIAEWQASLRDAQERARNDRVLFDRELFYALQPRQRLAGLIDRCRAAFE